MRASSGTASESAAKSAQVTLIAAAAAIATRCIVWFVEPPVARSATIALTSARSSTTAPIDVVAGSAARATARSPAAAVSAVRSAVCSGTKLAPGRWSPRASITSWFVFAVP